MSRFKTNPWTLAELLTMLDSRKVVLPEFQRDFVWWPKDIDLLLTSLVQDFPAGSLLFLKTDAHDTLAWRPVAGVEPSNNGMTPDYLVLDGQQRLTSLSLALKGRGEHLFFMDLKRLEDGDLDEGVYYLRRKDAARKKLDQRDVQFDRHTYPLAAVFGGESADDYWFDDYVLHHSDPEDQEATAALRQRVRGIKERYVDPFKRYSFPVVELPADTSLEAVCMIFETLNKTGMKLTVFDLLTAKFWPHDLRLRELYEAARTRWPVLGETGLDIESSYLLQAISLLRSQDAPKCTRRDLLELEPANFESDWERVCTAAAQAITMLRDDCGVLSRTWLPYATLLPAMFAAAVKAKELPGAQQADAWEKIQRWFWCSCIDQRYEGPMNTLNATDFRALLAWFEDDSHIPEAVSNLDLGNVNLEGVRRQRNAVYRSVVCLSIANGARDFHTGARITAGLLEDPKLKIEDHHVVPTGYLKKLDPPLPGDDSVLNRCLIDAITNRVISDRPPAVYLEEIAEVLGEEKLDQVLRSHFLPTGENSSLRDNPVDIQRFHADRLALLMPAIAAVTGAEFSNEVVSDAYLDPARPYSNELALKKIVRGLRGRVFWWEQHMDRKVLEVLIDTLDSTQVTELRLLSGPANISAKTKRAFERFVAEMTGQGVDCNWRILDASKARNLHARVLFDDDKTFELPPLNSLYRGTVDSIRTSGIPHDPFEQAWADPTAVTLDTFEPQAAVTH